MALTKEMLIESANKKGAEITFNTNEFTGVESIGVRLKNKFVYYWFEVCPWDNTLLFMHSYSQNTGKTSKRWTQRMRITESLGLN